MPYYDSQGREIEDAEWDAMRDALVAQEMMVEFEAMVDLEVIDSVVVSLGVTDYKTRMIKTFSAIFRSEKGAGDAHETIVRFLHEATAGEWTECVLVRNKGDVWIRLSNKKTDITEMRSLSFQAVEDAENLIELMREVRSVVTKYRAVIVSIKSR